MSSRMNKPNDVLTNCYRNISSVFPNVLQRVARKHKHQLIAGRYVKLKAAYCI